MTADVVPAFQYQIVERDGIAINVCTAGDPGKPPLLLVHGFPQTHMIWRQVARRLAGEYFLVMPDLRGYGDSSKPGGEADHANYSKRVMADDLVAVMAALGHETFFLCGHDRGARVGHRLAVDHPRRVRKLCVLDIAPTLDMYALTTAEFARSYYHWFHLIQPHPLPEMMISGDAKAYLLSKLGGWGEKSLAWFEPDALAEYERCFCDPAAIHAACEDYRASYGIDLEHDRQSRREQAKGGGKVQCDMLVLWGANSVVGRLFDPIALWTAQCAGTVSGSALPTGHFIPEEAPIDTAAALTAFLGR